MGTRELVQLGEQTGSILHTGSFFSYFPFFFFGLSWSKNRGRGQGWLFCLFYVRAKITKAIDDESNYW